MRSWAFKKKFHISIRTMVDEASVYFVVVGHIGVVVGWLVAPIR